MLRKALGRRQWRGTGMELQCDKNFVYSGNARLVRTGGREKMRVLPEEKNEKKLG